MGGVPMPDIVWYPAQYRSLLISSASRCCQHLRTSIRYSTSARRMQPCMRGAPENFETWASWGNASGPTPFVASLAARWSARSQVEHGAARLWLALGRRRRRGAGRVLGSLEGWGRSFTRSRCETPLHGAHVAYETTHDVVGIRDRFCMISAPLRLSLPPLRPVSL
jgi:hypothetical protein